jgi:putative zinc finger/helix-turn-helix YgiT family protein
MNRPVELGTESVMNGNVVSLPEGEVRMCDQCGAHDVRMSLKEEQFFHGEGPDAVELRARVPVWACGQCEFAYTDGDADEARHEAVCHHLRVLPPAKIRSLRESYGLTQAEFARVTGFGIASIKRWETGALIQGQAANRLLRLLRDDRSIMTKLRAMDDAISPPTVLTPVFRTVISTETRAQAREFVLRPAA